MERRIIVEGPDGAGKTTLIKEIVERYGGRVEPIAGFKNQGYWTDYDQWLDYHLAQENPPVSVHDRFFYSELVYAKALRGGKLALTPQRVANVKAHLRDHAFLIYCWLDYSMLVEQASKEEQMEGVIENLRAIYKGYSDLMGEEAGRYYVHSRYIAYNWTYTFQKNLWLKLDKYMGVFHFEYY